MALKFLNKKGWHTGSLRNIENVWKAEQKHDAEQKKLEELRKQIHEERERSEFRLLQEQAGLVPKQERLDFLYDSGLAVGKKISDGGFKALESLPSSTAAMAETSSSGAADSKQASVVPGALFEEKPQSANDTWRKLHSDPLLLIRQREQEALARVRNNPVQMAMIRQSIEAKKHKKERKKHRHRKSKHQKYSPQRQSDSKDDTAEESRRVSGHHKRSNHEDHYHKVRSDSEDESSGRDSRSKKDHHGQSNHQKYLLQRQSVLKDDTAEESRRQSGLRKNSNHEDHCHKARPDSEDDSRERDSRSKRHHHSILKHQRYSPQRQSYSKDDTAEESRRQSGHRKSSNYEGRHKARLNSEDESSERNSRSKKGPKYSEDDSTELERRRKSVNQKNSYYDEHSQKANCYDSSATYRLDSQFKRRNAAPKISEEERARKLQEMQIDAELHEEQRWKRLKKAEDDDTKEATRASLSGGKNFLDAAHKSVYGAEKGGSSTIEESVRRRTHFSQRTSAGGEGNAFRR